MGVLDPPTKPKTLSQWPIKPGFRGKRVQAVQALLRAKGYRKVGAPGVYDAELRAALRDACKKAKHGFNGTVAPGQWAAIAKLPHDAGAPKQVKGVYRPKVHLNLRSMMLSQVRGRITPRQVILHTTESGDAKGLGDVKGVASYLDRSTSYGIHVIVDAEGYSAAFLDAAGRDVEPVEFWHAGSANGRSFGIEQVGRAGFSLNAWWGRSKQLLTVARWLAYFHVRYGIPLKRSATHGIGGHVDVSGPGGHWDPGPGYPTRFQINLAQTLAKLGWVAEKGARLLAKR